MTPQPTEALNANIDRIVTALRETPAPTGMNQRIAARLAQAQAQPQRPRLAVRSRHFLAARLAPADRYALAAMALAMVAVIALHHKSQPITQSGTTPTPLQNLSRQTATQETLSARSQSADEVSRLGYTQARQASGSDENQVPQGFSLGSYSFPEKTGVITPASTELDPDALALAETLAPSHPAPIMPLTAEEHLLILATRQGQPIELAELETLREPALQARAEARERATIRNYIHSMLAPLTAAEAIHPTPPIEDSQPPSR